MVIGASRVIGSPASRGRVTGRCGAVIGHWLPRFARSRHWALWRRHWSLAPPLCGVASLGAVAPSLVISQWRSQGGALVAGAWVHGTRAVSGGTGIERMAPSKPFKPCEVAVCRHPFTSGLKIFGCVRMRRQPLSTSSETAHPWRSSSRCWMPDEESRHSTSRSGGSPLCSPRSAPATRADGEDRMRSGPAPDASAPPRSVSTCLA